MRVTGVIAGFFIIASCSGIVSVRRMNPDKVWLGKAFEGPRLAGNEALRAGNHRKAVELLGVGAEAAKQAGDWVSQGRFLANQGGAHMMLDENRLAIRSLMAGREAAAKAGDLLTLQAIEASLANVYVLTGDYEAAGAAAMRGALLRPQTKDRERQARTLMSFGRAMAKARGVDAAAPIWREALAGAEAADSLSLEADILDWWGYELGEQEPGRAEEAEELLARAWYKRKLANDTRLPLTEGKLARLYRKQGKIGAARLWIDRTLLALESGREISVPEWILRAEEARISGEEGRLHAALEGYRRAQRLVEQWRDKLPPMERSRLGAERRMTQELFEGYLRTAGRLYRKEPAAALAAEMFTLIQNTRAWSMEASGERRGQKGPLYSEARRMEGRWLAGEEAAGVPLQVLRASIMEQEAVATLGETAAREGKLEVPGEGEAVLTYWLHSEGSWLWVWTKRGLVMTALAEREKILRAAEKFRKAIETNEAAAGDLGLALRALLLGRLESECLRAKRWDIVADEGLFQVPFAALPGRDGGYLAEDMELRLVPNALKQVTEPTAERRFFAIADPIFNRADKRREQGWPWQRTAPARGSWPSVLTPKRTSAATSATSRRPVHARISPRSCRPARSGAAAVATRCAPAAA